MRAKFDFERTFHADVYFIRDSKARLARSKRALDVFAMSPDQRDSSSSLACSLSEDGSLLRVLAVSPSSRRISLFVRRCIVYVMQSAWVVWSVLHCFMVGAFDCGGWCLMSECGLDCDENLCFLRKSNLNMHFNKFHE